MGRIGVNSHQYFVRATHSKILCGSSPGSPPPEADGSAFRFSRASEAVRSLIYKIKTAFRRLDFGDGRNRSQLFCSAKAPPRRLRPRLAVAGATCSAFRFSRASEAVRSLIYKIKTAFRRLDFGDAENRTRVQRVR